MPNNFRLTGNMYVSKAGDDANAGTSPDAPKRTFLAGLNAISTGGTLIIGAGVYSEGFTTTNALANNNSLYIKADGEVVLDGQNGRSMTFLAARSSTTYFENITIRNYSTSRAFNTTHTGLPNSSFIFTNCTFINCDAYFGTTNSSQNQSFTSCKIINCNFDFTFLSAASITISKCLIINSIMNSFNIMLNSSVNAGINYVKSGTTAANFNYNNLYQTPIVMPVASTVTSGVIQDAYNRYYDLSLSGTGGSGSLSEPFKRDDTTLKPFYFSPHRIAYPTFNVSSSAVDPRFNSIEDRDFTIQADSPLLTKASDGTNIGGVTYAMRRSSQISFSGSSATVDPSLIFQYNNYVISGSQVTGSITSAPIAVSPLSSSKVIQKVTYNGLLAFNKDTGSASGSNQNVPDFDTFTSASGNAAANPDRLVYYMRHTTGSSIPVSDAGWDNGGLWTAGQYNVFEWNTKPSIDNLGVGNGSGSFNAAASPTYIQATYVQMQVKLRNDYLL